MEHETYEPQNPEESQAPSSTADSPTIDSSGGIVFDFNRLEHRTVTTSSLTDLYGFPVFSETFGLQVEQFHRVRREAVEASFLRVFTGESACDIEEHFMAVMRAEPELIIQPVHEAPPEPDSPLLMAGFVSLGMIAAFVVWLAVDKIMKKRKKP